MDEVELNPFTRAALVAVLVNNDFHYMHLMAKGADFDKSHNLAQEYYEKIDPEVDYLMELALEVGAPIFNYTLAGEIVDDYVPESLSEYDYQTLISHLRGKIDDYIVSLKSLRQNTDNDSIHSRLDDMVRDWEKELNYRLVRRIENPVLNQFVNTGLDGRTAALYQYGVMED